MLFKTVEKKSPLKKKSYCSKYFHLSEEKNVINSSEMKQVTKAEAPLKTI